LKVTNRGSTRRYVGVLKLGAPYLQEKKLSKTMGKITGEKEDAMMWKSGWSTWQGGEGPIWENQKLKQPVELGAKIILWDPQQKVGPF